MWACSDGFSAVSPPSTKRSYVRVLFGEPNGSVSNSGHVWLTALSRISGEPGQNERNGTLSGEMPTRQKGRQRGDMGRVSHVLRIGMHFWLTGLCDAEDALDELNGKVKRQVKDRYGLGRELESMAHRTFDSLERLRHAKLECIHRWRFPPVLVVLECGGG